ncbi:hypothetical protein [Enterococcus avium]|uniref:hypothetical protein n=1 Tax=Enterococcus avium TaxID=33945 RepID=UPI00288DE9C2|nr:hypothetical protein [Enterococcus avium]MDT2565989.1 hypothetical protein [Enterococcus avium]
MYIKVQPGIMGKGYIFCLFLWSFLFTITRQSTLDGTLLSITAILFTIVWALIRIFIVIKVLTDEISLVAFIKISFLALLSFLTFSYNDSNFLIAFAWFIVGAKGINYKFAVRAIFLSQFLSVIILFGLSKTGYIENAIFFRKDLDNNVIRYSYGFDHPNTLAARIFQIFCSWLFLRKEKLKLADCFLGFVLAFGSFRFTNSRTVYYLLLLLSFLILLNLLYKKLPINLDQMIKKLSRLLYLVPLFIIVIVLNFDRIFSYIRSFATGTILSRVQLIKSYLDFYGVSLFGKPIISTYSDNIIDYNFYALDNSYVYLLIGFGIIFATIFLVAYFIKIKQFWKNGEYVITIIMIMYLLYGFFETTLIKFTFNFTLIFLADFLWKNSKKACEMEFKRT